MSFGQHVSPYHGEGYSTMSCSLLQKCTMLKVQYHVNQGVHTTVQCRKCSTVLFRQHTKLSNAEVALLMASEAAALCQSVSTQTAVMHRLTGICSEKCVITRFRHCANIIECTYTNLHSIGYYTPSL